LSGNDNIHNEAYYVAINITFFWKMLNLFSVSKNISPPRPSVTLERFLDKEEGKKYKF